MRREFTISVNKEANEAMKTNMDNIFRQKMRSAKLNFQLRLENPLNAMKSSRLSINLRDSQIITNSLSS